jgi:protein-S-isoprenylcysteine O-methyltransferase Ste14
MMNAIADLAQPGWYRGWIQGKTRIILAWIFAFLLGFTAREYPTWPGVVLCFLGASLRFWASGYLRKDSRPAVGGPYAWVRNPLYLGTYLMALGVAWAIQNWILFVVISLVFAGIYHFIILDEENKLRKIFGEPYSLYCSQVSRFFPRVWPPYTPARKVLVQINPELEHHQFSYQLAMKNKAHEAFLSFFGLIGFVIAMAAFWKWI